MSRVQVRVLLGRGSDGRRQPLGERKGPARAQLGRRKRRRHGTLIRTIQEASYVNWDRT